MEVAKKTRKRNPCREKSPAAPGGVRPRILFVVGDADCLYTESRIWRLVQRFQARPEWKILSVTSDEAVRKAAASFGVESAVIPLVPRRAVANEQLAMVNELINKTEDIFIPGTRLPLWKTIAPDEFRGSMVLFGAQPALRLNVDLVIVPLMCVDNNSLNASGLYASVVAQARAQGIPVLAIEVSPLGNRYTMSQLPADHFAVKSHWSRNFLTTEGIATPEQISILRAEESSLLRPGIDSYVEAYLEKEMAARQVLNLAGDGFTVLIPHHVAFVWEVRQILRALAEVPPPVTVVIQANPALVRRQFTEPELIAKAYEAEIKRLDQVAINTQVGVGLMAQIADVVISPCANTVTEGASLRRKPVIICQLASQESRDGEFLYWQPDPAKIPEAIREWQERGILGRVRLRDVARRMLNRRAQQAA